MNPTIALLTDFGTQDGYVGMMKGVMTGICPDARMIDITHAINPQHVRQAAFLLMNSYKHFPSGTVFLVVIDPGVGSRRRPVAVTAGDYLFVAPDNGVLSYALAQFDEYEAVELNKSDYWQAQVSHTFHGRDIFAPVTAHLAAGVSLMSVGDTLESLFNLPLPTLDVSRSHINGEVVHVDNFGNVITSIGQLHWNNDKRLTLSPILGDDAQIPVRAADSEVVISGHTINAINATYSDVERGEVLALVGSSGYLEIAMNQGNAAERLDVIAGDRVELRTGDINAAVRD